MKVMKKSRGDPKLCNTDRVIGPQIGVRGPLIAADGRSCFQNWIDNSL